MKPDKSCLKCCVAWALGAFLVIAGLSAAALGFAGRWLHLSENPRPASAIIVLAGAFERSMYAADLYRQHYASKIYLSVPSRESDARQLEALGIVLPYEVDIHKQILLKKGVPAQDILTVGTGSLSTAQEAEMLKIEFVKPGTSLLVVTSPYHTRRSKLILDRAFAGTDIGITVVATPYEEFPKDWWRSQTSARNTLLELAKIAYFYAGGQFRQAAVTENSAADHNAPRP
jgi:uncharacterized SAM-binding protein YcdF (DUF218 family)